MSMMNEKQRSFTKEQSIANESAKGVAAADQPLEQVLQRLPTQYREEILKQYDLPDVKVSILTIFRYGTPVEYVMQVVGILFAITAGKPSLFSRMEIDGVSRRCIADDHGYHGEYDQLVWKFQ